MTDAVVFDDVSFSYPESERLALDGADLRIPRGVFVLVCGPTGSGKSTLLRAVNGLVPHFTGGSFSGRVLVEGRDTLEHAPRRLADVVAFVPQDPGAAFVVDRVEDELAYVMENLGVDPAAMRRRVEETLDLLDLASLRDRSVGTLSGGERQRVAIAAALTAGARVLVLDEPTSQLDPQGAEDVLAALQRLVHDLGMTVVVAEHRLERVAGFADLAIGFVAPARVRLGPPVEIIDVVGAGPPVARLGRLLGWSPVPLTVREARRFATDAVLPSPTSATAPDRGASLVSLRRVSASYGAVRALAGIDLDLYGGEVVAVVGRNGSGKTTLLRTVAGLHEPSSGIVRVDEGTPRAGGNVALCPQQPEAVLFADTVAAEIAATIDAAPRCEPRSDVGSLVAALGLEGLEARHPRDLSAGQRLLVAVAAVAATGAPLLLLDEPTRGLDQEAKRRLGTFLRAFSDSGQRAVMLATHDVELAAEVATRVVMLAGGEVIADGPPAEVLADSPVFSPQTARVFGPPWLTPTQVARALGAS